MNIIQPTIPSRPITFLVQVPNLLKNKTLIAFILELRKYFTVIGFGKDLNSLKQSKFISLLDYNAVTEPSSLFER